MIDRTDTLDEQPETSAPVRRTIALVRGARPGPLVVVVGGLHGNEPAGIAAAEVVARQLAPLGARLAGAFLAVRGNLEAGKQGVRFLDRDLNRLWLAEQVAAARTGVPPRFVEEREMQDFLAVVDGVVDEGPAPVVVLDLHSTSAHGPPFAILADTPLNRALAAALPVPLIFGVEEVVQGALVSYCAGRGHRAVVFEGGQHSEQRTAHLHEAMIWTTLEAAGALGADDVPERARHRAELEAASEGCPRSVRVAYRHMRSQGDRFKMVDAFRHFHPVCQGDVLATDRSGPIRAGLTGYLMMPSYQDPGDDGFFLGVEMTL